jgi:acetyltransferase-like isoleucine patch superfamily enzyme
VTILPGVKIGKFSVIGAGSVVVDDIPEAVVAVGNPAKVIKRVSELKCTKGFLKRPYEWQIKTR